MNDEAYNKMEFGKRSQMASIWYDRRRDGEEINLDKRRRRTETTNRQWMKLGIEKKHKLADARNCDILR